ncbi:helix-turn-helix domain-containing protein [Mangrovicoccus ximenensis]|uniref:helix-turn-helix domain-containing protein n=1 Tax=Mangrovicoccus ximenensis TaxID=1911570 RepID=UPI000D33C447|nr:helix-turn-helix domain-containing protein [Mangrovicoccus ximenensis]
MGSAWSWARAWPGAAWRRTSTAPISCRCSCRLASAAAAQARSGGTLKDTLEELEAKLINDAIIRYKGNKKKAAEYLGVSRSYLYKKLEALGADPE